MTYKILTSILLSAVIFWSCKDDDANDKITEFTDACSLLSTAELKTISQVGFTSVKSFTYPTYGEKQCQYKVSNDTIDGYLFLTVIQTSTIPADSAISTAREYYEERKYDDLARTAVSGVGDEAYIDVIDHFLNAIYGDYYFNIVCYITVKKTNSALWTDQERKDIQIAAAKKVCEKLQQIEANK